MNILLILLGIVGGVVLVSVMRNNPNNPAIFPAEQIAGTGKLSKRYVNSEKWHVSENPDGSMDIEIKRDASSA